MPAFVASDKLTGDRRIENHVSQFFRSVSEAAESALLLDFDGTLAPFRIDPATVKPWPGIRQLLQQIQDEGRTRIVVVTGRPAQDVASRLILRAPLEIWGLHGSERLYPDGSIDREEISPDHRAALAQAGSRLRAENFGADMRAGIRIEEKPNAVAVHWRGSSPDAATHARKHVEELLRPFARSAHMRVLLFDCGIELRAGRNKGHAVKVLIGELPAHAPVAYLGDDTTDEDAFHALAGRGLCVLVRPHLRPSAASLWLRTPTQLRRFLASWLIAVTP